MAEAARRHGWTEEDFFAWLDEGHGGEHRWELLDGAPKMMVRPAVEHGIVVNKLTRRLGNRLAGTPCLPFGGDYCVRVAADRLRVPDVLVDCGERVRGETVARNPTVVFEVLSPSTRGVDSYMKLEEYKRVAAIQHIVIVEPLQPDIAVWSRDGDGWAYARITDPDAVLPLTALNVDLPLAEIYEDIPPAA